MWCVPTPAVLFHQSSQASAVGGEKRLKKEGRKMTSVAILVICGSIQLLCALTSLLTNLRSNEEKIVKAFDLDFVAIFLYTTNGILLLNLAGRKKNLWWVPLLANISTVLSLLAAGGLVVMALLAIQNHPPHYEAIVLFANSLLMLFASLASTKTVCALWFCTGGDREDIDVEALVNLHVLIDDNDGVELNKNIYRSK